VWTINTGTAATGYKGVLVDRNIMQGDGVDDSLESGNINITYPRTQYTAFKMLHGNNSNATITDGTQYSGSATYPTRLGFSNLTFLFFAGSGSSTISDSELLLKLYTSKYNLTTASNLKNNSAQIASFATVPNDIVKLRIFRSALGSQFGNFNVNTIIISSASDTTIQETAMYNYIRSINGNSF
jgi:hypothetical protein